MDKWAIGSSALQGEAAGPGKFEDAERLEQAEEGVDLLLVAGHLDDERARRSG